MLVCLAVALAPFALAGDPPQALFPLDHFPHQETPDEVRAREVRLARHASEQDAEMANALAAGRINQWITAFFPVKESALQDAANNLFDLSVLAIGRKDLALRSAVTDRLLTCQAVAFAALEKNFKDDISKHNPAELRDLNTVQPAEAILETAFALKLLGKYSGQTRERTETFIQTHVENHRPFTGSYYSTGYNKEVYLMDVGSLVTLLYADIPNAFPVTKKTFRTFWDGIVHRSYDADNSPHYDAATGFRLILRMAVLHGREEDLRQNPRFHDMMTRMAQTVANNGQTAKWGKSMGPLIGTELMNDGSERLSWTLKIGYRLFNDPFLLYTARKYEDLRLFGANKGWRENHSYTWPAGINFQEVTGVVFPPTTPLSVTTSRITSKKAYQGLQLGRGDTDVVPVQDKLILTTGRHPLAPYLLMDLSYTQSKAAGDHRIGVDNYMFGATHLCTYLDRPGEASRMSRPFICPKRFPFPIVDAVSEQVWPSKEYQQLTGYDSRFDYVLAKHTAANPAPNYACGTVEYSKFQYEGIRVKREVVLVHNGVVLVMDRIQADSRFKGDHNAGVIYQLWPGLQQEDPKGRWVVQSPHAGTAVLKDGAVTGNYSALFYFPPVGTAVSTAVRTDPKSPNAKLTRAFCAWTDLAKNSSVSILSMIIPLQDPSKAGELVSKIVVERKDESYQVRIPCAPEDIQVLFSPEKAPVCGEKNTGK